MVELELELEPVPLAGYEMGERGTLETPGELVDSHGPGVAAESGLARSVFIIDGASSDPYDGGDDDFPSIDDDESTSP